MSASLSFSVRNLGPIRQGTVQLHPLTILIGKNNTGKTYMARAIYSAHKAIERINGPDRPVITSDEFNGLRRSLIEGPEHVDDSVTRAIRQRVEGWMHSRLSRASDELARRLTVYFDLDSLEELRRWSTSIPLQIAVESKNLFPDSAYLFGHPSISSKNPIRLPNDIAAYLYSTRVYDIVESIADDLYEGTARKPSRVERHISTLVVSSVWGNYLLPSIGLTGTAYYLPAGRSGLLEAWTDVVRLTLERDRDRLILEGRDPVAVGGIALDFLSTLQTLIRPYPHIRRLRQLRRPLADQQAEGPSPTRYLNELINGEVGFARARERVLSLSYTQAGHSIPVQRASSMVAELAPLITWIDELLLSGDLLIIDELESHMHPEAILAVAQTLVALASSGVNVLCTTHSPELLHQVSNCMLRASSESLSDRSDETSIDASAIGVYRFDRSEDGTGTDIKRHDIDPHWGIPEDEYVEVAERLSSETADLVDSLL